MDLVRRAGRRIEMMLGRSAGAPFQRTVARLATAALLAVSVGAGCSGPEFSKEEWSRLESLSAGRATVSDDVPVELQRLIGASCLPERVKGLGLPPADCSNRLTWSPFLSDLSSCPNIAPEDLIPDDDLAAIIRLGRQLYFDPAFSGATSWQDVLQHKTTYGRPEVNGSVAVSCADCHDPRRDGIDRSGPTLAVDGRVSVGAGIYDVNSQATVNAAYYKIFYWNGRSDALWSQITAVNESVVSMNSRRNVNFWQLWDRYWAMPGAADVLGMGIDYETLAALPPLTVPRTPISVGDLYCKEPYKGSFDTITRVYVNFAKVIAAYEQTLVRASSAFDQFVADGPESTALSPGAKRGARLFVGKAACFDCHNGPLFSDSKFHNVGVPQTGPGVPTFEDCGSAGCTCDLGASTNDSKRKCAPWGAWDGLGKLRQGRYRRDSKWSDTPGDETVKAFLRDTGTVRGEAAGPPDAGCPETDASIPNPPINNDSLGIPEHLGAELVGAWRTPTLRDVAATGPYMHTGVYATLDDVVGHYNHGGAAGGLDEQARRAVQITPLDLTIEDQRDLVEFLRALTSRALIPRALTSPPSAAVPETDPCK